MRRLQVKDDVAYMQKHVQDCRTTLLNEFEDWYLATYGFVARLHSSYSLCAYRERARGQTPNRSRCT